jgi:hypothetical protein
VAQGVDSSVEAEAGRAAVGRAAAVAARDRAGRAVATVVVVRTAAVAWLAVRGERMAEPYPPNALHSHSSLFRTRTRTTPNRARRLGTRHCLQKRAALQCTRCGR